MISSICKSTAYVKTNMFDKTLIYISENNNSNKRTTFINN